MVKLKRLKIHHYRNIRPGTELHFDDGINLVLGQNGAGKTTLLALISAACRSAFVEIANEEFEIEYDLSCTSSLVRARASHRRQPASADSAMSTIQLWEDDYEIDVEDSSGRRLIHIARDPGADTLRSNTPLILDWSFIAAALSNRDERLTTLRAELLSTAGSAYRFDESLDCFAAATGRPSANPGPALPKSSTARWHRFSSPGGDGVDVSEGAYTPGEFANAINSDFRRTGERPSGLGDAETGLATQIAATLRATAVSLEPNVKSWQRTAVEQSYAIEGFTFWITRQDGKRLHHDHLSYGQKRIVGFFYYLALNPCVAIADELVNGLHHKWIEGCMEAIGDRQAFLTSQNPLLFEYVEFKSVEQVQSCFITCKTELVDDAEQLVWHNMPRPDALSFFESYQADIESVGDILITRGLW